MSTRAMNLRVGSIELSVIDDSPDANPWLDSTTRAFQPKSPSNVATPVLIHRIDGFRLSEESIRAHSLTADGGFVLEGYDFVVTRDRFNQPFHLKARADMGLSGMLRWLFGLLALENNALLVHAASFAVGSRGVVCPAYSGSGKSTLSRKLLDELTVFNDETCLIEMGNPPKLYASPFYGELGAVNGNAQTTLEWLLLLNKGPEASVVPIERARAAAVLAGCIYVPLRAEPWLSIYLERVDRLTQQLQLGELTFSLNNSVAKEIQDVIDPTFACR